MAEIVGTITNLANLCRCLVNPRERTTNTPQPK